jgi:hypothetical protein
MAPRIVVPLNAVAPGRCGEKIHGEIQRLVALAQVLLDDDHLINTGLKITDLIVEIEETVAIAYTLKLPLHHEDRIVPDICLRLEHRTAVEPGIDVFEKKLAVLPEAPLDAILITCDTLGVRLEFPGLTSGRMDQPPGRTG